MLFLKNINFGYSERIVIVIRVYGHYLAFSIRALFGEILFPSIAEAAIRKLRLKEISEKHLG